MLHDRIDIRAVSPMTEREYQASGSTVLLNAIGRTIHKICWSHNYQYLYYADCKSLYIGKAT